MLTLILWWTGILVEALILVRAVQLKSLHRFPFFFFYIASVLVADIVLFVIHLTHPMEYFTWASRAEVLNIILGYGIILEICRHVFSRYPGIDRLSQTLGLVIFSVVLCVAIFYPTAQTGTSDALTQKAITERDFLTVQMVFFLTTISIIRYYTLEISANLRGLIFGYGIWLGVSVITLELRAFFGPVLREVWLFSQPFFYLLCLSEWLFSMWKVAPIPELSSEKKTFTEYEYLAAKTALIAEEVRAHLGRMPRP